MLKRALIAVAVLAIAAPGYALAKGAKKEDTSNLEPPGPVPYSELGTWDAKVNGHEKSATHHHHMAKKKASKGAAAGSAEGGAAK